VSRRRKVAAPSGPPRCRICGAVIFWGLCRPGEGDTKKPLDPSQPVFIDLNQPDGAYGRYYDEYRCRLAGQVLTPAEAEQPSPAERRLVKCYPVHECPPEARDRAAGQERMHYRDVAAAAAGEGS